MNPNADEFKIGGGYLTLNGSDIGGTTEEGIVVIYEPDVYLHKSSKFGSTPIKASLIGQKLTLEATLGETTKENMAAVFDGVTSVGAKRQFGGVAGREIAGATLVLTPFDGSPSWHFANVVVTDSIEVTYQADNPRVYKVTFTAMVDGSAALAENIAYVS